jgi:hypothetical protein
MIGAIAAAAQLKLARSNGTRILWLNVKGPGIPSMTANNNQQRSSAAPSRGTQVFFQQGCPVCGRRLEIDVNLLGRRVYCQHCGGGFVAMDASLVKAAAPIDQADVRVDALLERAALALEQASADGDAV